MAGIIPATITITTTTTVRAVCAGYITIAITTAIIHPGLRPVLHRLLLLLRLRRPLLQGRRGGGGTVPDRVPCRVR